MDKEIKEEAKVRPFEHGLIAFCGGDF